MLAILACGRQAEFLESDRLKDGAALPKLPPTISKISQGKRIWRTLTVVARSSEFPVLVQEN